MAVSVQLGNVNLKPDYLNTTATVTMKKEDPHGWTVTGILAFVVVPSHLVCCCSCHLPLIVLFVLLD